MGVHFLNLMAKLRGDKFPIVYWQMVWH